MIFKLITIQSVSHAINHASTAHNQANFHVLHAIYLFIEFTIFHLILVTVNLDILMMARIAHVNHAIKHA